MHYRPTWTKNTVWGIFACTFCQNLKSYIWVIKTNQLQPDFGPESALCFKLKRAPPVAQLFWGSRSSSTLHSHSTEFITTCQVKRYVLKYCSILSHIYTLWQSKQLLTTTGNHTSSVCLDSKSQWPSGVDKLSAWVI